MLSSSLKIAPNINHHNSIIINLRIMSKKIMIIVSNVQRKREIIIQIADKVHAVVLQFIDSRYLQRNKKHMFVFFYLFQFYLNRHHMCIKLTSLINTLILFIFLLISNFFCSLVFFS